MARVTVEDAVDAVGNRFDLILVAARRARQIAVGGKTTLVDPENDFVLDVWGYNEQIGPKQFGANALAPNRILSGVMAILHTWLKKYFGWLPCNLEPMCYKS